MEKQELDIDAILSEVSWRLKNGTIDFDTDESVNTLREVLLEMGYNQKFVDEFVYSVKYPTIQETDTKQ